MMEVDAAAAAAGVRSGDLQQKQDDAQRAALYEALFGGPDEDDVYYYDLVACDRAMPRGAVAAAGYVRSNHHQQFWEKEGDHFIAVNFLEAMGMRSDDLQEQEPTGSYPMEVDAVAAGVRSGDRPHSSTPPPHTPVTADEPSLELTLSTPHISIR
jgi:hypothetical protein